MRRGLLVQLVILLKESKCEYSNSNSHSDDSLPGLRRQTHSQLLLVGDQVCAGLNSTQIEIISWFVHYRVSGL